RDPRFGVLFHHVPDLLDHSFEKIAPNLEVDPNVPARPRSEEELAIYQINHKLLLQWAYIPLLVDDLVKNREALKAKPSLIFDLASAQGLELSQTTRELLADPRGRAFLAPILGSPFTLALVRMAFERGEADPEDLVYYLQKFVRYQAKIEEYHAVGARWRLD